MITKGILGTKGATEQVFSKTGDRIPVTRISTSPCFVVAVKTHDVDGYWAIQIAFGEAKKMPKPQQGIITKAGIKTPLRFLKEIRFDTAEVVEKGDLKGIKMGDFEVYPGQELSSLDLFAEGDTVTVTGISKGKGFQGVVKRHGFKGGKRTHGQSDRERAPGSIGSGTTIGRVFKGLRMAGRMGGDTITVKNLEVIAVEEGALLVKGIVPGVPGGLIVVRSASMLPEKVIIEEETPVVEEAPIEGEAPVIEESPVVEEAPVEEVTADTTA